MSYDISIHLEQGKPRAEIEALLARQPFINGRTFAIQDTHFMEVDPECDAATPDVIHTLSFHIPYALLDQVGVDFDPYFDCINALAQALEARAYDAQLDKFLDDLEFAKFKPALIQTALQLSQLSREDDLLCVHCAFQNRELLWNLARGAFAGVRETPARITNYDVYNDQASNGSLIAQAHGKEIHLIPADESAPTRIIKRIGETLRLEFVDDTLLLSASHNKTLKLWDTATLKCLRTFKGHYDEISDFILFSPRLLISSSVGGSLIFWDFAIVIPVLTLLHSYCNAAWIAIDAAGNFEHSENYKGVMRWGFGRQQFTPHLGLAVDTWGGWNYQPVPGTQGTYRKGLLAGILDLRRIIVIEIVSARSPCPGPHSERAYGAGLGVIQAQEDTPAGWNAAALMLIMECSGC